MASIDSSLIYSRRNGLLSEDAVTPGVLEHTHVHPIGSRSEQQKSNNKYDSLYRYNINFIEGTLWNILSVVEILKHIKVASKSHK